MRRMHIAATATTCRLVCDQSLSADQLDQLIRRLAETRAAMTPPVPPTLQAAVDDDATSLCEPLSSIGAVMQPSGTVFLHVRHSGLGWLLFSLQPALAAQLAGALGKVATAVRTGGPSTRQ